MPPTNHHLYGGAITANIPNDMIDASTIRPIPSHQEVYLSSSSPSSATTPFTSLIFEITERVSSSSSSSHLDSDHEALLYHFEDIVEEGHFSRVWDTSGPIQLANFSTPPAPTYHLIATVTPPPNNNNNNNNNNDSNNNSNSNSSHMLSLPENGAINPHQTSTVILLSLIRLVPQATDLLVSINIPMHQGQTTGANSGLINFEQGEYGQLVQEGIALRDDVVGSLQVQDWGLFDGTGSV